MNEAALWKCLSRAMGTRWEAQRHEDKHSTGIPDVSYVTDHHGWIELKSLNPTKQQVVSWMKRPVRIPHYTAAQRAWAKRFGAKGGRVWLFVRIDRHFLLFGWWSVDKIGKLTLPQMMAEAHTIFHDRICPGKMVQALASESTSAA